MNTELEVIVYNDGSKFVIPDKDFRIVSTKELAHFIKTGGYSVRIMTAEGVEYTKEILVKMAFQGIISVNPMNTDTDMNLMDMLLATIDEEKLYEVIENGCGTNYLHRKRMNLL